MYVGKKAINSLYSAGKIIMYIEKSKELLEQCIITNMAPSRSQNIRPIYTALSRDTNNKLK